MLRQSPSRSNRSKKIRPRHSFQALLLLAVGIWIVYQLTRSYGKRRGAVVVETDGGGEPAARRRLGRKGFVGQASDDVDIVAAGVGGQGGGWDAASSDDQLSKAEDRDGDEEDQEADEADTADDADEEDDDRDLLVSPNDDTDDELETLLGESDRATLFGNGGTGLHGHEEAKELNGSAVQRAKATARVQDAAATSQQTNATNGAAEGWASVTPLTDSPLRNGSSVNLLLQERGTATAEKLVGNGSAVGAENEKHTVPVEDNRKETADAVAGQGISS